MQDNDKRQAAVDTNFTESLGSIKAVVEYLAARGWKIKKSAVYKHRKEGKLRPQTDGTFAIRSVDKYATDWLSRADGAESIGLEKLQEEKAAAELKKLQAQAIHWDTKTKIETGQYIPKENWTRELASRAMVIKSDMKNFIYTEASEIIRMVEGNSDKTPDLIDYYLRRLETWVDRYSRDHEWPVSNDISDSATH